MPEVRGRKSLHNGEDCIVNAGQKHKEHPVVESQKVLLRHENRLTHPEQNHLGEPREEVAGRRDDISFGVGAQLRTVPPVRIAESSAALVKLVKLANYDRKTNELYRIGNEARYTDDVVKNCLEFLNVCAAVCKIPIIHHGRRIQEEEIFNHVTDGKHEGQDEHGPLRNLNESIDANVQ